MRRVLAAAAFALLAAGSARSAASTFTLVGPGRTCAIVVAPAATDPEKLAASEIAKYVRLMTGRSLQIRPSRSSSAGDLVIRLRPQQAWPAGESYALGIENGRLMLTGGRGRSVLFAAYDLLGRLGCRWLAPALDCYGGEAEVVPRKPALALALSGPVRETPALKYRKLYVEEGISHDTRSLLQMVEWMPKGRWNTLVVPADYQGRGRVKWDNWRQALTPALRRRDITIEVGGHGYQNFLNSGMEEGRLFGQHPEWFGANARGQRQKGAAYVLCTSNAQAVQYLTRNVLSYLRARPEIDIFDLWPPDGARWCACQECEKLGSPADRQARLLGQVITAAKAQGLKTRFECIAYSLYTDVPRKAPMPAPALVDFCPIAQSFESQIYSPASLTNAKYAAQVLEWTRRFAGEVSIYSYYRKYAWRSLPVLLPHYMQADLKWYAGARAGGISTYAEPGDWRTYELNHYALARLAWNPDVDMARVVREFSEARFGTAAGLARDLYDALEQTVRRGCRIPGTSLKSRAEIEKLRSRLLSARDALARSTAPSVASVALVTAADYALHDLALQAQIASGGKPADRAAMVDRLLRFLERHRDSGLFLDQTRLGRDRLYEVYQARAR